MPQTRRLSPVTAFALGLVALHTILRGWTLQGAWFYTDDYRILTEARESPLTWAHLVDPYDYQLMPWGRLVAWFVADAGVTAGGIDWLWTWPLTLALVALSGLACWWALSSLFGPRWLALVPLALYLTNAMTLPASMWWAAALNQVPPQLALFLALGSWVRYLRGRRLPWLVATVAALGFGLTAYVKMLLVFPVLVLLLLGWFIEGRPATRLRVLVRDWWQSVGVLLVVGGGYAVVYRWWVEQPFDDAKNPESLGDLLWVTVGESLVPTLLGGPWGWDTSNSPVSMADPPQAYVVLAWLLLALVLVLLANRRAGVGKALALFAAYMVGNLALLAVTRGAVVGSIAGTELRYLTDALPVAVVCLGLAMMSVPGAPASGYSLDEPRWGTPPTDRMLAAVLTVVLVGGVVNTVSYARVWHTDHPGAAFLEPLQQPSAERQEATLVDQTVPDEVMNELFAPANRTGYLLPLLSDAYTFPEATDSLLMLDQNGDFKRTLIEPAATGDPTAPVGQEGCPWPVERGKASIPLSAELFDWDWWALLSYAASDATPITVTAGRSAVETELDAGFNSLYVRLTGAYDELRISGIDPDAQVCVSAVTVGNPVLGGDL